MKTYYEFLNEGKHVGLIYHYTTLWSFVGILSQGVLLSDAGVYDMEVDNPYISFTRKKNIMDDPDFRNFVSKDLYIGFEFDGDKLSDKYKIVPYNYYYHYYQEENPDGKDDYKHNKKFDEMEERLFLKNYKDKIPINRYLTKIILMVDDYLEKKVAKEFEKPLLRMKIGKLLGIKNHDVIKKWNLEKFYQKCIEKLDYKFEIVKK